VHGSLFGFHRNDIFDAHNYFDSKRVPVPPLGQNQFGGALGGSLVKDRSFFFVSYEGLRMNRSLTRTFSVPSDATRTGDVGGFAPICDPLTIDPETGHTTPSTTQVIKRAAPKPARFWCVSPVPENVINSVRNGMNRLLL
jgi:hypothetical protein